MNRLLIDHSKGWLVGQSVDWLVGWSISWLVGWLVGWLVHGRIVDRLVRLLVCLLVHKQIFN